MDSLGKPKNTEEMLEEIKKLELKIQQYERQISKNRKALMALIDQEEAERLLLEVGEGDEENLQRLIKQVDNAMDEKSYNKQCERTLKKLNQTMVSIKESLAEAPKLYSADKTQNKPITKSKKAGKYKKSRKSKKRKNIKKSKKNKKRAANFNSYKKSKKR